MARAFIGVPQDFTIAKLSGSGDGVSFLTNDEPGLVFNGSGSVVFNIDVLDDDPIRALCVLGVPTTGFTYQWQSFTTIGNRNSNTAAYSSGAVGVLSANRSAEDAKHLLVLPNARGERYWRLTVTGGGVFQPWRVLLCKVLMPGQNIEVKAQGGVDDRSERRYARSGRRTIDPTVICPSFKGDWPWLETAEMQQDFRPLMYKNAGTHPVLFCMDYEETSWGEDATIYGDLEKAQAIGYEEDNLFSFSFTIVAIAP